MFSKQKGSSKSNGNANLRVVVRLRPPNEAEESERYSTVTHAISDHMLVFDPKVQAVPGVLQAKPRGLNNRRFKDLKYAFDHVFGPGATNREVFEHATKGIVSGVLNGYNCSVFAYGATGAGKTHTMLGSECEPGVIYFTMMDLYRQIEEQKQDKIFDVAVSYSEVYNEQVRDLLRPGGSLPIREDKTVGVIIAGLSLHKPKTAEDLLHMLQFGNKNRTQHPTDANAESSRSHAVFQVFVSQREKLANLGSEMVMAKMCLVDLAGSERAHCTTNCGARFREGANINRSLLALGNVINALADNKFKGHIPYRDSKLTRLLKDSLGGNCRTVMIAAVSPSSLSFEDTYNTLRYADRAKHIRADIKKNVMSVDFHITNYKKYVQDLEKQNQELRKSKQQLLECLEKAEAGSSQGGSPIMRQLQERLKDLFKVRREMRKRQMDSEGAKRELKWKVSRREQAIKRVQQLTASSNVLHKHCGVIERMKKRIGKEEQGLQQCELRIQDQDNLIRQAVSEFMSTDRKQTPEVLDLNFRGYILESNLHDSDMYLAFVKKLARAQERQAAVTESLVTSLLQLVKRQHDVLHSQDLLSPELQHKYEQCCYLVEERGVAFSQLPAPPGHSPAREECGDGGVSPSDAAAAAGEEHLNISDIIDIRIPRLRAQGLLQRVAEVKSQAPQRVLKPTSAVRPTARVSSTQEATSSDSPAASHQSPPHQGIQSQYSPQHPTHCPEGPLSTAKAPENPIEQLNCYLEACSRQRDRNISSESQSSSVTASAPMLGDNSAACQNPFKFNHHQVSTCAPPVAGRAPPARVLSGSPPPPSLQHSPVSLEANSSTDNLNNTFQVLQPALPNTPCIDGGHQQQTPQRPVPVALPNSTPRGKKAEPSLQHKLNFQPLQGLAGDSQHHSRSLLAQGDGRGTDRHHHQLYGTRLNANNGNSNLSVRQTNSTSQPSQPSRLPAPTPYKAVVVESKDNTASSPSLGPDTNISSISPKSYAEAVKSPPVRRLSVKTPLSSKPPNRIRVVTSVNQPNDTPGLKSPEFSLSQFKQRLQQSCEKLPARVELPKLDSRPVRQPLQSLDPNNSHKTVASSTDMKSISSTGLTSDSVLPKASRQELSHPSQGPSLQSSLKLKAPPQRRHQRVLGASKPYSVKSPRRHRRWQVSRPAPEVTGEFASIGRPSYMQPTFARSQKMLGQDADKLPQRQTDNPAVQRRPVLHKQRFVLA